MDASDQSLSLKHSKRSSVLTAGFALFSMFFGAGNLVFPLLIGQYAGPFVWYAVLGLGITAVLIPFLGLGSMVLFQGDYTRFFGRLGTIPGLVIVFLLQLILGPLGVIPRLMTLMHATASPYVFHMPLIWFSLVSALIIFVFSFKKDLLIRFLGAFLTPILLISLLALFIAGLCKNPTYTHLGSVGPLQSFTRGFLGGYHTMDLLAAFLFATVILPYFKQEMDVECHQERKSLVVRKLTQTSLIAAVLLFLTYVGLCLISSKRFIDPSCPPQNMLNVIALDLIGPLGGAIASVAVFVACLTTSMSLSMIFADYLKKTLVKNRISQSLSLACTLLVAWLFSLFGFEGIIGFLGPILQVIYPGLILLTLLNLFHFFSRNRSVKTPVFLVFALSTVFYLSQKFF